MRDQASPRLPALGDLGLKDRQSLPLKDPHSSLNPSPERPFQRALDKNTNKWVLEERRKRLSCHTLVKVLD